VFDEATKLIYNAYLGTRTGDHDNDPVFSGKKDIGSPIPKL